MKNVLKSLMALAVGISISFTGTFGTQAKAETMKQGKCSMTIISNKHTSYSNGAQASGECSGLEVGFYNADGQFLIMGMVSGQVSRSGQTFVVSTPGSSKYPEHVLTVYTSKVNTPAPKPQPKPEPKPTPAPKPTPTPKPTPKPVAKPESKPKQEFKPAPKPVQKSPAPVKKDTVKYTKDNTSVDTSKSSSERKNSTVSKEQTKSENNNNAPKKSDEKTLASKVESKTESREESKSKPKEEKDDIKKSEDKQNKEKDSKDNKSKDNNEIALETTNKPKETEKKSNVPWFIAGGATVAIGSIGGAALWLRKRVVR